MSTALLDGRVALAGRMSVTEAVLDRHTRHRLRSNPDAYVDAIRSSACGTLTCCRRAVGLVRGIPQCGPCGDALTDDLTNPRDDE